MRGKSGLTTLALTVPLALAGCDKRDVVEGTYVVSPSTNKILNSEDEHPYVTEMVEVEAWEKPWGRRMIIYNPNAKSEHIQATDSTEFGDTRLWEEASHIAARYNSPLAGLKDPEKLEEIWNAVYVKQKGEKK